MGRNTKARLGGLGPVRWRGLTGSLASRLDRQQQILPPTFHWGRILSLAGAEAQDGLLSHIPADSLWA